MSEPVPPPQCKSTMMDQQQQGELLDHEGKRLASRKPDSDMKNISPESCTNIEQVCHLIVRASRGPHLQGITSVLVEERRCAHCIQYRELSDISKAELLMESVSSNCTNNKFIKY